MENPERCGFSHLPLAAAVEMTASFVVADAQPDHPCGPEADADVCNVPVHRVVMQTQPLCNLALIHAADQ